MCFVSKGNMLEKNPVSLVNFSGVRGGSLLVSYYFFPFLLTPSQGSQTAIAPDGLHSPSGFHLHPVFLRCEDHQDWS